MLTATNYSTRFMEIVAQIAGAHEQVSYFPDASVSNSIGFTLITGGPSGTGWVAGTLLGANPFGQLATFSPTSGGYLQTAYVQLGTGAFESIQFYQTTEQQTGAVPEPASLTLLGVGALAAAALRFRRAAR